MKKNQLDIKIFNGYDGEFNCCYAQIMGPHCWLGVALEINDDSNCDKNNLKNYVLAKAFMNYAREIWRKVDKKKLREDRMPKPKRGETREEYISRTIKYLVEKENLKQEHAVGKAYGMWANRRKKK